MGEWASGPNAHWAKSLARANVLRTEKPEESASVPLSAKSQFVIKKAKRQGDSHVGDRDVPHYRPNVGMSSYEVAKANGWRLLRPSEINKENLSKVVATVGEPGEPGGYCVKA